MAGEARRGVARVLLLLFVVCCFGAVSFVVAARSCLRFYGLFALLVVGPCMLLLVVAMLVGHYDYQLDICADCYYCVLYLFYCLLIVTMVCCWSVFY